MVLQYRADIDGLRAIAVVPVVLFHAGLPWFSGGYVGVDIFFVISGFLITTVIRRGIGSGRFSILSFYAGRARRLFPAYIFVLFITLMLAWGVSPPFLVREAAAGALSSSFFVSNIYYAATSGYFGIETHQLHLVHMWSLAVEEQFYLVFPIGLLAVSRVPKVSIKWLLIFFIVVSFGIACLLNRVYPSATYYLIFGRAWELLVGALVAVIAETTSRPLNRGRLYIDLMVLGGLLLILVGFIAASITSEYGPAVFGVMPVLGTAVILFYGRYSIRSSRLLSFRPLVFVGLISYSLYLWHQPVVVFSRELIPEFWAYYWFRILVVVCSVVIAWSTWRLVENPFRRGRSSPKATVFMGVAGLISLAALSAALYFMPALYNYFASDNYLKITESVEVSPLREKCHRGYRKGIQPRDACTLGGSSEKGRIALVGDSHVVELAYQLSGLGYSVKQYSFGGCLPVASESRTEARSKQCGAYHDAVLGEIDNDQSINLVMFAFRWGYYTDGLSLADAARHVLESAAALKAQGMDVLVLGPIPELSADIRRLVPREFAYNDYRQPVNPESIAFDAAFRGFVTDVGVGYLSVFSVLCDVTGCPVVMDGQAIYYDDNHLSLAGASILAQSVQDKIGSIL